MPLILPKRYKRKLLPETTEVAIKMIKDEFQRRLAENLNLRRVTAPLFVLSGTGLNDDLNGVERAVGFPVKALGDRRAEVVHSLAKWKRVKLGAYDIAPGFGLYTDMNAIRADEELDNLHSMYVDQWDWEQTIKESDRTLEYLKETVRRIFPIMNIAPYSLAAAVSLSVAVIPGYLRNSSSACIKVISSGNRGVMCGK